MRLNLTIAETLVRMGLYGRAYSYLVMALQIANRAHDMRAAGHIMVAMQGIKRALS